ncbi:NADH dehydrogenase [ubiquinone] 1 beta subcomplex subunit 9-like [Mya arenaria]|uniref:NADH dehydrogenase [ubiquinone] 1 beta subcomplex subunit 9-like n=1 Tax=Mya arenaria TaxID=6604 RepID=UPI0022DF824B|nr:NADH dehydrogenase [ubiquinone] 1 beta subcomplex subunit 9-like [Mya arenaria]
MSAGFLTAELLSHQQKVLRLYKKALRQTIGQNGRNLLDQRYNCLLVRQRFEKNRNMSQIEAQTALADGEEECYKYTNPSPLCFPNSVGGTAYMRYPPKQDAMIDMWHPFEKAQFPHYFAVRDIRKREHLERYDKMVEEYNKKQKEGVEV